MIFYSTSHSHNVSCKSQVLCWRRSVLVAIVQILDPYSESTDLPMLLRGVFKPIGVDPTPDEGTLPTALLWTGCLLAAVRAFGLYLEPNAFGGSGGGGNMGDDVDPECRLS